MSEGSLYNYVGTKSDILHLIAQLLDRFGLEFREFMKGLKDISRTEVLCKCWRYYTSLVDREQDLIMISHRETVNFAPDDRANRTVEPMAIGIFEGILHEGVECGEFTCSHPKQIAYDMWTLAHDWALKRWLLKGYFTLEQYTEWHLENFLKLLGVSTEQLVTTKEKQI